MCMNVYYKASACKLINNHTVLISIVVDVGRGQI